MRRAGLEPQPHAARAAGTTQSVARQGCGERGTETGRRPILDSPSHRNHEATAPGDKLQPRHHPFPAGARVALGGTVSPSPAGAGPVEDLVHGRDTVPPHGGHVPARHDGVVHARVQRQFLGSKRGTGGAGWVSSPLTLRPPSAPVSRHGGSPRERPPAPPGLLWGAAPRQGEEEPMAVVCGRARGRVARPERGGPGRPGFVAWIGLCRPGLGRLFH